MLSTCLLHKTQLILLLGIMFIVTSRSLVLSLPKTKNQTRSSTFGGTSLHQTFAAKLKDSLPSYYNLITKAKKDLGEKTPDYWKHHKFLSFWFLRNWYWDNKSCSWITNSFSQSKSSLLQIKFQHQVYPSQRPQSLIFMCFWIENEYSLGNLHFKVELPIHRSSHIRVDSPLPTSNLIPFLEIYSTSLFNI